MSFAPSGKSDRDAPARAALYRTRLLVNRTPHFSKRTRKEANRGLDLLESQLGRNQVRWVLPQRASPRQHPPIK